MPAIVKSENALRTIREVADELALEAYVLRFWEKEFPQLKPLQQGNGRRYYQPEDVALIRRIQHLLHEQGYTIKGARAVLEGKKEISENRPASEKKSLRFELEGLHQQLQQLRHRIALQLLD